jgi:hypothetical protein
VNKNDTGRACVTFGARGEMHTGFWLSILRERNYLEDLGVGCRIMLKFVIKKWDEGTVWMDLAQDTAK